MRTFRRVVRRPLRILPFFINFAVLFFSRRQGSSPFLLLLKAVGVLILFSPLRITFLVLVLILFRRSVFVDLVSQVFLAFAGIVAPDFSVVTFPLIFRYPQEALSFTRATAIFLFFILPLVNSKVVVLEAWIPFFNWNPSQFIGET